MSPPIWLDAAGRRRPTRACWTCGRERRYAAPRAALKKMPHRVAAGSSDYVRGQRRTLELP